MGGGYDDCEDADNDVDANNDCATDTFVRGNRIFVIDAVTGDIKKSFVTERPVPGAVTVVPVSDDGSDSDILYAYATDAGGNVYRISGDTASAPIGNSAPADWTMTQIASLGCGTTATATCDANRKFLFGPDVVKISATRMGILVGSGDREKPLVDYGGAASVQNYFFSLIDEPLVPDWLDVDSTCGVDILCTDALTEVATGDQFDPNTVVADKGWFLPLAQTEQVVTAALVVANTTVFSTHIPFDPNEAMAADPNTPVCGNQLGVATTYNVDYRDASGEAIPITGGGLVPTPVAGKVIVDGVAYPFIIGGGEDNSAIGGGSAGSGSSINQPKTRVYWKIGD
jgi:type IV pilus assembly protein PilY1